MYRIGDRVIYSASDLIAYLDCDHLVKLEHDVMYGSAEHPPKDPTIDLIAKKGMDHERKYRESLEVQLGGSISTVDTKTDTLEGIEAAVSETVAAMERGERFIYQGVFFDGTFIGKSDFLRRVERPCARWPWSYEVVDTKLALNEKPYFIIQLSEYSRQLALVQGSPPQKMHVVLGDGREVSFTVDAYAAYYQHLKASFLARDDAAPTYPLPCKHCKICIWDDTCEGERIAADHLSQVAWIRRDTIARLEENGITTMTALADAEQRPKKVIDTTFERLQGQARMQVEGKRLRRFLYELLDQEPGRGFARLPEPDPGDLFFDFEGDPLFEIGRGLEYLFGIWCPGESPEYVHFWAGNRDEERTAVERFIDFLVERRRRFPNAHFYHYAPYETTALQRVTARHFTRQAEVDDLLREQAFVDLYPIVRQTVVISQPSYSIKKLEPFYDMHRTGDVIKGDDSIVQFERWLLDGDPATKAAILHYNAEDCRSTRLLHQWLLTLRFDYARKHGAQPIPFRPVKVGVGKCHDVPDERCGTCRNRIKDERERQRQSDVERALLSRVSDPVAQLLGALVAYHRREIFPEYWDFYARCDHIDRLVEFDDKSIGGLSLCHDVPATKRGKEKNLTYTYAFPEQDFDLEGTVFDPATEKKCGDLVAVDADALTLQLKLTGAIADPSAIKALIPPKPQVSIRKREEAITEIGAMYLDGSLGDRFPVALDLLHAAIPRRRNTPSGTLMQPEKVDPASVTSVVKSLDSSYAFIQGPPGTGKTYTGARVIVSLLESGKRIAVMATSHKVVHNLLHEVEKVAAARGLSHGMIRGIHKSSDATDGSTYESYLERRYIGNATQSAQALSSAFNLVSGTMYLFVEPDAAGAFDYLFIDEAGQVSLADALGTSRVASNVVLLGDPMQLGQVTRANHPFGAERSVLRHVLGERATIPEDRGIFLKTSYRMQPEICKFISESVYDGRLDSAPSTFANRIEAEGLSSSGLRFIPVEHVGHSRESEEEAQVIVGYVQQLMRGSVVLNDLPLREMTEHDILVVTPYNAQRKAIGKALASSGFPKIRVGTVDKFQGQEAPVVFYSMATSSPEDAPRAKSFLYEKNRFNVAVSRGQCLSIVVCSPKLLDARCNHVEEIELVNLLCKFAAA